MDLKVASGYEGNMSELSSSATVADDGTLSGTKNARKGLVTSLQIIRKYMVRNQNGTLDASGITSKQCFDEWCEHHKSTIGESDILHALKSFRRALAAHVTGSDGRAPLTPEEEAAVLRTLRLRVSWECSVSNGIVGGHKGFRAKGYHEKRSMGILNLTKKASKRIRNLAGSSIDRGSSDDDNEDRVQNFINTPEPHKYSIRDMASRENRLIGSEPSDPSHPNDKRGRFLAPEYTSSPTRLGASNKVDISTKSQSSEEQPVTPYVGRGLGLPYINVLETPAPLLTSWALQISQAIVFQFKADFWPRLHEIAKLVFLAMGVIRSISLEEAKAVVARVSAENPGQYVMILNHTVSDYRNKVVYQNDLSVEYFGRISESDGGYTGSRCHPDQVFTTLGTVIAAYIARGRNEVHAEWVMKTIKHGYRRFETHHFVDLNMGVVIERGRLMEDT